MFSSIHQTGSVRFNAQTQQRTNATTHKRNNAQTQQRTNATTHKRINAPPLPAPPFGRARRGD
ncbi:MAG: hypothetical protein BRD55_02220 [Bacteroidetes bacterium SW_9_63_38]|nr:MAG: hypothetical protein BRD55_02220 [Bacteroidetes bacterium SW_9_63_38]